MQTKGQRCFAVIIQDATVCNHSGAQSRTALQAELRRPIGDCIPRQEHSQAATISRGASAEEGSQANHADIDSTSASATGDSTPKPKPTTGLDKPHSPSNKTAPNSAVSP